MAVLELGHPTGLAEFAGLGRVVDSVPLPVVAWLLLGNVGAAAQLARPLVLLVSAHAMRAEPALDGLLGLVRAL